MVQVQAVDLDPVVVAAARQEMGFPPDRCASADTLQACNYIQQPSLLLAGLGVALQLVLYNILDSV